MKKVLFVLGLVLLSAVAFSQPISYTPFTASGYSFKYVRTDSGFAVPLRDTSVGRGTTRPGSIVCRPQDSLFYGWNGARWSLVNSDLSSVIALIDEKVDSVTVDGDSIFYWKLGVSYGYVFSTASWLLTGNNITSGQFLGSLTAEPLLMKINDSTMVFVSDTLVTLGDIYSSNTGTKIDINTRDSLVNIIADNLQIIGLASSSDTTTYKPIGLSSAGVTRRMSLWPGGEAGWNRLTYGGLPTAITDIDVKYIKSDSADFILYRNDRPTSFLTNKGIKIVGKNGASSGDNILQLANNYDSIGFNVDYRRHVGINPTSLVVPNSDSALTVTGGVSFSRGIKAAGLPTGTGNKAVRWNSSTGSFTVADTTTGGTSGWGLTGNAGTGNATDFVGTTDNQSLYFKVNGGTTAMRIDSSTRQVNIGGKPSFAISAAQAQLTIKPYTTGSNPAGIWFDNYNGGALKAIIQSNGSGLQIGEYTNLGAGYNMSGFLADIHNNSVSIGSGLVPATSSVLDLVGTTKGLLVPRMTAAQRAAISSPATALQVYDTDSTKLAIYANSRWNYIPKVLISTSTLDFGSTAAQSSADLTITVTGAADGDVVDVGFPNANANANTCYTAFVSATNTVTVRFNNYSSGSIDPASATFKVSVLK